MVDVPLLAAFQDRFTILFAAAMVAWIMSVCLHEFSHALVAYWGGDRSVRERGYLSMDPTKFIDPVMSLLLPAIALLMGGIPFPGGAVQIDESRLKSRRWGAYVAAAGPASNFILFLAFALPLNPAFGLVDPFADTQPTWVYFFGAMASLEFISVLFNLIPLPPLDGYRMIEDKLDHQTQLKMRQPGVGLMTLFGIFMFFRFFPKAFQAFFYMLDLVAVRLGVPSHLLADGYNFVLFGET